MTVNGDGSYAFAPAADYTGPVPVVTYTVSDGNGGTDTSTLTLTMVPVNDAPDAVDNSYTTAEDTALTIAAPGVLGNDTDVDGDTLTVTTNTAPANGAVLVNADGSFTYTPDVDFNGTDTFTYTISDGNGGSDTATVTITVDAVNDAPTSVALANQSNDDSETVLLDVSGSFSDVDAGDSLTFSATGLPPGLSIDASGNITGTIDSSASTGGPYSVTVTATDTGGLTTSQTFTWAVANPAPVANDDAYTTDEDTALTVPATGVLGNDIDADGDALTAAVATGPANGSVTVNGDGSFTYTPDVDFNGTDTFTYTVTDADGATDTATVTINVTPVNDAPVDGDETANVTEDTTLTVDATSGLLANATDTEGDSLSITDYAIAGISGTQTVGSVVTIPGVGGIQINADGSYSFAPVNNYTGAVPVVTYTVSDGNGGTDTSTLTLTMVPVNDAPDAVDNSYTTAEDTALTIAAPGVLGNDTDVDGDTLTVTTNTAPANGAVLVNADGSLTYTPDVDFNGTDTFTYTISDGNGGTDTATVTINVGGTNDAPVDGDETANVTEDTTLTVDATSGLLANATDTEGDSLSITDYAIAGISGTQTVGSVVTIPGVGGIQINADGSYSFAPVNNYTGAVPVVTYTVSDGNGGTDTSTLTLTMVPVNDAPDAVDNSYTTAEDTALTIAAPGVLGNDTDVDGDTLTVTTNTAPANGAVLVNADGSFTYTPDVDFNGTDTFTYTISDGNGGSDTATVTITVDAVNDAPTSVALANQSNDDSETVLLDVSGSFSDVDAGDSLTFSATGLPPGLSIDASGNITGTIDSSASTGGPYSVTVTATDTGGLTTSQTFTWAVANPAPVANDDAYTTDEDTALTVPATGVLGNDIDADGDALTAAVATGPANGSVTVNGDGSFTYTPDVDFNGTDTFTYTVTDADGATDTATVTINVTPVNDAPVDGDETANVTEDTTLTVDATSGLLANATDTEGDTLSVSAFTVAGEAGPFVVGSPYAIAGVGTLTVNGDGSYSFAPAADYTGPVPVVTYTVSDGNGGTDTSTLTLTMVPVNDAPDAVDDRITTAKDTPVTVAVLTNDRDTEGHPLTVTKINGVPVTVGGSVLAVTGGVVALNPDHTITFTPMTDFNGDTSFNYSVADDVGGESQATVFVRVGEIATVISEDPFEDEPNYDRPNIDPDPRSIDTDLIVIDTVRDFGDLPPGWGEIGSELIVIETANDVSYLGSIVGQTMSASPSIGEVIETLIA